MVGVPLWKAHGLGNDYLVWEGDPDAVSPGVVQRVCARHTGVGSDGLLVPGPGLSVRIWNPDGSEAEKSGNGVRIFGLWWSRRSGETAFTVRTAGGDVGVEVRGSHVSADMGRAVMGERGVWAGLEMWPVNLGNPHRVVLGWPEDWRSVGAEIEHSTPGRTNVQFVRVLGRDRVEARIWERGAGETMASGSSASAVARVVGALGMCEPTLMVSMAGGDLRVDVDGEKVRISGEIVEVCSVVWV